MIPKPDRHYNKRENHKTVFLMHTDAKIQNKIKKNQIQQNVLYIMTKWGLSK